MRPDLIATLLVLIVLGVGVVASAAGPTVLEGTLSVVGNEPFAFLQLRTNQGRAYQVTGPLVEELRAMSSGYTVRVVGSVGGAMPPLAGSLKAYGYRIVAVQTPGGQKKPIVGRVATVEGEVYLVTDDLAVYLLRGGAVSGLKVLEGAMVVAVGKARVSWGKSRTLVVDAFAVLKR